METCVTARLQPRQLAFALPHAESLTRDNFLEGPANAAGLALIDRWPDWPSRLRSRRYSSQTSSVIRST